MPLYTNPDFRRLPNGLASIFDSAARHSFFTLPAWYDLMARHGVSSGTEIRVYTDERPGSSTALLLQATSGDPKRLLASLANAYSIEHAIICRSGANLECGLTAILSEILAERPRWDCLLLRDLDAQDPNYRTAVGTLRRAGLLVECVFHFGTWYEETAGLSFGDYLAARPSDLRNNWIRKRRRIEQNNRLTKVFFA